MAAGSAEPRRITWRSALIAAVLLLVALAGAWRYFQGPLPHLPHVDRAILEGWISPLGAWAPVGFVVVFALLVVIGLPSSAVTLAGGALFGFGWGLLLNGVGAMIGAVAGFYLARWLGRSTVERWLHGALGRFDASLEESGFSTIFTIRLCGLFPYSVVNYASGVSRISFRDYMLGTLLGFLPGEAIYTYLGASLVTFEPWPIALGLAGLGALSFGTLYWKRKREAG